MKDTEEYAEMGLISQQIINTNDSGQDFVNFLRYCADALKKGGSVPEVWNDFLHSEK